MLPVKKHMNWKKPFKMAAESIDKFIKPTRCLYKDYATTIEDFQQDNSLLLSNYDIEDLGADSELKLYAEFSEDGDGELSRESVQTWICDNRLEVTSCICIALDNCKLSFCNWYRASEQYSSPDEMILYCLAKQNNKHVCIFNDKYVWSTLAEHIKFDYFEVLKRSSVALIYLGPRKYAILRKKKQNPVSEDTVVSRRAGTRGKGRGSKSSSKKVTCRTSGKKGTTVRNTSKQSVSLQTRRKEKYGVGSTTTVDTEKYGRVKRSASKGIDYSKLNDGLDTESKSLSSPKRHKYTSHTPV